jgi:hypothetical protein
LNKENVLTAEKLRELLDYAPATGHFYWRKRVGNSYAGKRAGTTQDGLVRISIGARVYQANRLAWLHVHGRFPEGVVDHINGDRSDNRIANLRDCSHVENARNRKCHSISGLKGVVAHGRKWKASIAVDGRDHYLGLFTTKEEAGAAYDAAARRLHGEFARLNAATPSPLLQKSELSGTDTNSQDCIISEQG